MKIMLVLLFSLLVCSAMGVTNCVDCKDHNTEATLVESTKTFATEALATAALKQYAVFAEEDKVKNTNFVFQDPGDKKTVRGWAMFATTEEKTKHDTAWKATDRADYLMTAVTGKTLWSGYINRKDGKRNGPAVQKGFTAPDACTKDDPAFAFNASFHMWGDMCVLDMDATPKKGALCVDANGKDVAVTKDSDGKDVVWTAVNCKTPNVFTAAETPYDCGCTPGKARTVATNICGTTKTPLAMGACGTTAGCKWYTKVQQIADMDAGTSKMMEATYKISQSMPTFAWSKDDTDPGIWYALGIYGCWNTWTNRVDKELTGPHPEYNEGITLLVGASGGAIDGAEYQYFIMPSGKPGDSPNEKAFKADIEKWVYNMYAKSYGTILRDDAIGIDNTWPTTPEKASGSAVTIGVSLLAMFYLLL